MPEPIIKVRCTSIQLTSGYTIILTVCVKIHTILRSTIQDFGTKWRARILNRTPTFLRRDGDECEPPLTS